MTIAAEMIGGKMDGMVVALPKPLYTVVFDDVKMIYHGPLGDYPAPNPVMRQLEYIRLGDTTRRGHHRYLWIGIHRMMS